MKPKQRVAINPETLRLLEEGVQQIRSQEEYIRYLKLKSSFWNYSWRNRLLIFFQYPQATMVAGEYKWKQLGRTKRPDARPIMILRPIFRSIRETREDGSVKVREILRRFDAAYVLDLSQTDGPPLPQAPKPQLLKGDNPQPILWTSTVGLLEGLGFHVRDARPDPANGITHFDRRLVEIHEEREPVMRLKTLIHEAGHVLLHEPSRVPADMTRDQMETEAESVAFLTLAEFGIDSSSYSFPYLVGWGTDSDRLFESLDRISKAADRIIQNVMDQAERQDKTGAIKPRPAQAA
jgi:hypothetical protein